MFCERSFMEQITIMFSLPEPTLKSLRKVAKANGVGIEVILQNAVKRDVAERSDKPMDTTADVQFISFIRTILANDFTRASGWKDLQRRLHNKGYTLHRQENTLSLHRHPCGTWLCNDTDLGSNYERMTRRFWACFTNHSEAQVPSQMTG